MKKCSIFFIFFLIFFNSYSQFKSFRFALISDTHISETNISAEEDLRRTVHDINSLKNIAFVILTGDITEMGTTKELQRAKEILDSLNIPYYIIPGNHDTGWSETGGEGFIQVFGKDKFDFYYQDIHFIGCASGPYVRMSDGHIPRSHLTWLENRLDRLDKNDPVIFFNHYPINNSLDNWYQAIDLLKEKNVLSIICGHGHTNKKFDFEGIAGTMCRSNLRAKESVGGYNIVDVKKDSLLFSERKPGVISFKPWNIVKTHSNKSKEIKKFERPSYAVNDSFPFIKTKWKYISDDNIISKPLVKDNIVVFGNKSGIVEALNLKNGKRIWKYKTAAAIFSSLIAENDRIVFGSADGYIYCLNILNGKLFWKLNTQSSVLASAVIKNSMLYIGNSNHSFKAIDVYTGKEIWSFNEIKGPITSSPIIVENKVLFAAWDSYLYALDRINGKLLWKWNNGSENRHFSPAACTPVVHNTEVYIVAPDRYITAIDLHTGFTLWRNNDATVRESIGISEDGKYIYAKTMNDELVAYKTSKEKQFVDWKVNCKYGYEHAPSMLTEMEGLIFFGTRNGRVYAVNNQSRKVEWIYKIDNSMVNTVTVINKNNVVASTMDGKVVLLERK